MNQKKKKNEPGLDFALRDKPVSCARKLCRRGPHSARHFAGAALWCTTRNADNCTLLYNLNTLDTSLPEYSIPVMLEELLELMWGRTLKPKP